VIRTDGDNVEVGGMTNFNVEAAGVVNIYTADGTHQWQFGDDGSLTVPGAITQGDAKLSFNENNSTNVYLTPTTDDTSAVFINAVGSQVYGKETVSILGGAGVQAALDLFLENRQLLRDLFDQLQGEPGFPWGITQPAGGDTYDELLSLPSDTFPNQTTAIARANSLNQAYSTYQTLYNNSEVTLAVGDTAWRIDSEGFLNAPNQRFIRFYDEQGAFNGAIGGDNLDHVVFNAGANKGIKVFTDDGTNLWTFGTDGSLTLPAGGDILDSNGDSVLGGSDATGVSRSDDNLIIRLTDPNDDGFELRNILVDGNDANVASTVLGANGFVISTNSNVDQKQWQFGNDGSTIFPNGLIKTQTNQSIGILAIDGGSLSEYPAQLMAQQTSQAQPDTVISSYDNRATIQTDVNGTIKTWTFGRDGSVTFPDSTVQTTAYVPEDNLVKVSGEWTVTAGTNTYSFTVPADGTYIMWVKGNIPNGIITWNATASVSNTNVPAIGTQYAWNYTGGGSPILLTSIPDQIKGVAGTISTDNTYLGTTSNRFDFGISNTSGSTQTIYYGYTKIS
jgi:hypothetical protein